MEPGSFHDELTGEFMDNLPYADLLPRLSDDDVAQFVAMGQVGRERSRAGDPDRAEAAFRRQIAIFPGNYEPYVNLALLEASRGSQKEAIEYLRSAVARGFTDLPRIERAEAWTKMRRTRAYMDLLNGVAAMLERERDWPGWDSIQAAHVPDDLGSVLRGREDLRARIDAMSPALGDRLTRLWYRMIDRSTATLLQAYVTRHREAPDFAAALDRLMALYAGGPLSRWGQLPPAAAGRLDEISGIVLERYPDGDMRPAALMARALARNTDRDKDGRLRADSGDRIRKDLEEIVTGDPDSPLYCAAVVGLVGTEAETGRLESAEAHYLGFRKKRAGDTAMLNVVQEDLGPLALRLGGLPEFQAATLGGQEVNQTALRDKVVVMDFWATWCGPCVEEFPSLRRIDKRYGEEVMVLGVNMDWADAMTADDLRAWIADEQVPGDHVYDGLSWDSELVKAFGVKEIPFSVVVGSDGEVLAVNPRGKQLEKTVRAAVSVTSGTASP